MSFLTVKLLPGVKLLQTPTLIQANVVASNLIRWRGGLPEKIGGWINFFTNMVTSGGGDPTKTVPGIARALWAWADINLTNRLAVATSDGLSVILMGETGTPVSMDITPEYVISTGNPNPITFATDASTNVGGTTIVTITDNSASVNVYGTVQIQCHVAVGGIVIFGAYPITKWLLANQYTITVPGTPTTASVTTPTTPSTALFAGAANSEVVTVTLANHGLVAGMTFSIAMPTFIGVVDAQCELYGFYTVQQVIDANNFIIFAHNALTVTSNNWEANLGGAPQIIYWVVQAPLLPNSGWGVGGWGIGGWGSGAQPTQLPGTEFPPPPGTPGFGNVNPDDWTLANFGSVLLSNPTNGPLFQWDPLSGLLNAGMIPQAPAYMTGFFISMPAQQVIAYGASTAQVQDPMLVAWCDNARLNVWTASTANQAGTFRLTRGSRIVGGLQGPQQAMLWTDVGLWVMAYLGYPNVYGFNEVAQGCGLIGQHAICVYGNSVFWMGRDAFWMYTNGAAQRLPCDVWDVVFKNLNVTRDANGDYTAFRHIRGGANSGYDEVFWSFPSRASQLTAGTPFANENDSVVKFNPVTGEWDYTLSAPQQGMVGSTQFNLTAWIDNNIFGHPISAMIDSTGSNSFIFQHEMGVDANGQPINWMIQTGFFMLSDGEDKVFVDYMLPDFRWRRWQAPQSSSATVEITLWTAEMPDDPQETWIPYGPFLVTNKAMGGVEPRCRGRYFFATIQGNDLGSFVRLGGIKFRFAPDGRN
jgi:hypothetical protein